MQNSTNAIPVYLKLALTIKEAAEYSNIGINKIESMLPRPIVRSFFCRHQKAGEKKRTWRLHQ